MPLNLVPRTESKDGGVRAHGWRETHAMLESGRGVEVLRVDHAGRGVRVVASSSKADIATSNAKTALRSAAA